MKRWHIVAMVCMVALLCLLGVHVTMAHGLAVGVAFGTTEISDIDELQKIIYDGTVIDQVVTDSELMDQFLENTDVEADETTGGYYIKRAHIIGLPGGVGARAEGDYIPEGDAAKFINSIIYLKKYQAIVGPITGDVMRRIKNDDGAYADYMEQAMPWTVERLTNTLDADYIGYGASIRSRAVGTPSLIGAGVYDLVIDSAMGISDYEDPWLQHLVNERLVFSTTAAGTVLKVGTNRSALVLGVDPETNTLRLGMDAVLAGNIADDDFIFPGDNAGTSSQNAGTDRALQGLTAAVDDGGILDTYLTVDRTDPVNRSFCGLVIEADDAPWNGEMSDDLLVYADQQARVRNAARVNLIVASLSAANSYWKSLKGDRVFNDPQRYVGGKRPIDIALGDRIVGIKEARKLPPQLVFGLTTASFTRHHLGRFLWDDITGSIWNRVVDANGRKDEFYAAGNMYEQLSCKNPMKNWRIDKLSKVQ